MSFLNDSKTAAQPQKASMDRKLLSADKCVTIREPRVEQKDFPNRMATTVWDGKSLVYSHSDEIYKTDIQRSIAISEGVNPYRRMISQPKVIGGKLTNTLPVNNGFKLFKNDSFRDMYSLLNTDTKLIIDKMSKVNQLEVDTFIPDTSRPEDKINPFITINNTIFELVTENSTLMLKQFSAPDDNDISDTIFTADLGKQPDFRDSKDNLLPLDTTTRIVIFIDSDVPFLSWSLGVITSTSRYIAPYLYDTGYGVFINLGPIYGDVDINQLDGTFLMSFKRSFDTGKLVDQYIRTPFIPYREQLEDDEYAIIVEPVFESGRCEKWYVKYYDPLGSGKVIAQEEYQQYQAQKKKIVTNILPNVLGGLLGY